jgi:2-polyprenyl-3-methyl-5-hydroxy-6-metoxy-1,4-benzoquinol methylase
MANMDYNTLERIVPDQLAPDEATGMETYKIHLERYMFAKDHVYGDVLDAACGVGYGARIIAEHPRVHSVSAVDIDPLSIAYARERYQNEKISFFEADLYSFRRAQKFDCIVSLETIEHVPYPDKLLSHFHDLLRPGGTFIASVPITPSVDANPHHLTDFTLGSFLKLLKDTGFEVEEKFIQIQPFSLISIITGREKRASNLRKNILRWYVSHPGSLVKRIWSTLLFGFSNRYATVRARRL